MEAFSLPAARMMVGLAVILAGCGKATTSKDISQPPERNGSDIGTVEIRYLDEQPSLSADGTKGVFISGMGFAGEAKRLQAYRFSWPAGEGPSAPEVLVSEDLGHQTEAHISPDGNWVVLVAAKGARTDLYLVDFAGTKAPVQITNDDASETDVRFSPDSALLAWVSRDVGTARGEVKLVAIGAGTSEDFAEGKIKTLTPEGRFDDSLFFVPPAAPYTLIIGGSEELTESTRTYRKRTFASVDEAADAEEEVWLEGFFPAQGVAPAVSASTVVMPREIRPSETLKYSTRGGDAVEENPRRALVKSEPVFVPAAGGDYASFETPVGQEVHDLAISADGALAAYVTVDTWTCAAFKGNWWGRIMVLAWTDLSVVQRLIPRYDPEGKTWELTNGLCEVKSDDGKRRITDTMIRSIVLVPDAKPEKYRLAYVTRFSTAYDEACNLRSADSEIRLIDFVGGKASIYNVWPNGNSQTIASAKRDKPCGASVANGLW